MLNRRKNLIFASRIFLVPRRGLEPPRGYPHWHLRPARLPIPPPGHVVGQNVLTDLGTVKRLVCASELEDQDLFTNMVQLRFFWGV